MKLISTGLAALIVSIALIGCGGGGASGSSSATPLTLNGIAATGAPIANAVITVLDATGTSKSTTADASGNYTLDVTGLTRPFLITASGNVGDEQVNLSSVVSTTASSASTVVANINPLTHAVASSISASSDPTGLANSMSRITNTAISDAISFLSTKLGTLASNVGLNGNFNPISDSAIANSTGIDKLLDNIAFSNQPGTGAIIFLKDGATIDDMSQTSTPPNTNAPNQSAATITLGTATDLSSATPVSGLTIRDYTVTDPIKNLLNTCFAISSTSRSSDPACNTLLAAPDYLNDSKSISSELSGWMSADYDNSTFTKPEIIRFYSPNRALAKFTGTRTDGVQFSFISVVGKISSGNPSTESSTGTWTLWGNQRTYSVAISGQAMRQVELNPNAIVPSGYYSTLTINISPYHRAFASVGGDASTPGTTCTGSACSYVKVSGPGLNTPLIYKRSPSCVGMALTVDIAHAPGSCTSVFKLNGVAVDPTKNLAMAFDPAIRTSNQGGAIATIANYSTTGMSSVDSSISSVLPYSPYVFEIHNGVTNSVTYIVERLRGRPPTTDELSKYKWLELTDATLAKMQPGANEFAGGSSIDISWTRSKDALPAFSTFVQFQQTSVFSTLVSQSSGFPVSNNVGTINATVVNHNANFPSPIVGGGGRSWIGLMARTTDGTLNYSAWSYSGF